MKKEKLRKKIMEKIAIKAAKEEANTVYPLITYQPIQPQSVKKII